MARDLPLPEPPAGEVRIRTLLAGICNTDLEIVRGYAGFSGVLGHEFTGVVDAAEDQALVGRRVVGEINASCGECRQCRSGRASHCANRTALGIRGRDGALAEFFCLPARNLHPVPDGLPDDLAVFAEPLAAACEVLEQVHVRPTDRAIVVGDGKLGLLVAQVLAMTACDLLVVGHHEEKLAILAARGLSTLLDSSSGTNDDGKPRRRDTRGSDGLPEGLESSADVVVECTGRAEGWRAARRLVRPRGTLVLKSTFHGQVQTDLAGLVVDEVQVVGSRCGPFPAALRCLERGWVDVRPLITAEYSLDESVAAFEHAGRPAALKILVRP